MLKRTAIHLWVIWSALHCNALCHAFCGGITTPCVVVSSHSPSTPSWRRSNQHCHRRFRRHDRLSRTIGTPTIVHNNHNRVNLFQTENDIDEDPKNNVTLSLDDDGNFSDDSIEFVWEVGNVHEDLQVLEQAIHFQDAEFNLLEAERIEMMDAFAARRRLVLPDLHTFVTGTLRWSLVFVVLQRILQHKSSSSKLAQVAANHRLVTAPWDFHFWAIVVLAPIIFLQVKKRTMAPPEPMPDDLKTLDPEYLRFATTDWEDPETSCRDYVLCLAEQWVSAVKGMAWFGLFRLGCFAAMKTSTLSSVIRTIPYFPPATVAFLQLLTRLGAMVSIYQFPKLLFQLQRKQQPRPVRAGVSRLQKLVKALFRWGLPIGVASDLSQVLMVMPQRGLVAFYGMSVAFLSAMEILYSPSRKPVPPSVESRKRDKWPKRVVHVLQCICASGALVLFIVTVSKFLLVNVVNSQTPVLSWIPWLHLLSNGALLLALINPLCHLRAFQQIFQVVFMHDLSLTTNVRAVLSNPQEVENRYKWRHRLRWRDPERIQVVRDRMWGNFWYWWFIGGSVEDQLARENDARLKEERNRSGMNILDLVKKDIEFDPFAPTPDRRLWKKQAMDNVAAFHQRDYDKNSFSDPLGVAVQQRLGIGLRFTADHTRRLGKGEKPSTRRLQSRAAKSAIVRVQNLYEDRNRQTAQVVESVADPQKRQKKIEQIRKKVDDEVAFLANRLSELIPTESDDELGLKFQNFVPDSKINVGGQELAVNSLLRQYGGSHPNSTGAIEVVPLDDDDRPIVYESGIEQSVVPSTVQQSDLDQDEFMEAYLKEKFGGGNKDGDDDDDQDGVDTILV